MKKFLIAIALILGLTGQTFAIDVCNVPANKTVQYALYDKTGTAWVQATYTATGVTELPSPSDDGNSCYAVATSLTAGSKYTAYWKCTDCSPVSYAQEAIDSYQTFVDAAITSRGTGTALDAAGIRTAIGMASANLDTQIADLPTVTEFEARTLPSADYVVAGDTIAGVTLAGTCTNLTNLPTMPTDWMTAIGLKADAVTEIQTGLASPTNITAGTMTTCTNLTNLPATAALEGTLEAIKGATFDTSTDSLEAIRNRGDVAWITGGATAGAWQTTATVYVTSTTTPIADYALSIYDSTNTLPQFTVTTGPSGTATFNLDAGTYKLRGRKTGYVPANATETLVVAADGTATYYAAAYTITAPASADVCRVYEWITAQDGETIPATVKATAQIVSLPYNYGGRLMAGSLVNGTYNATTGLLYFDIVKGARVEFKLPVFGYDKQKVVPTDSTKRLSDLE